LQMKSCKTIKESSKGVFKDKRSEFYAFIYPVKSEDEIKEIRKSLKKKYHDAKHHVYAFRIGCSNNELIKMSDDGEPHNSSAPPVLSQIKAFNLSNVLIVVVRYFGGKKLGIPGLINAYKTASKLAIENAKIVELKDESIIDIKVDFDKLNGIMNFAKKNGIKISYMDSSDTGYTIGVLVDNNNKNSIKNELVKLGCEIKQ
jgi:uncharacterized YigZ family protein